MPTHAHLALLLLAALASPAAHAQFDLEDSLTTADLRGIHAVGNGIAWASGTNGAVRRTEDGGLEWQPCAIPPGAEHLDFRGIQAFDENTAIVMSSGKGDLSRLYKTTDGCRTWKLLLTNPDKEGFWDAIRFIDAKRFPNDKDFGALLGDPVDGRFAIFLTLDRGEHWERQIKDPPAAQPDESIFAASNSSLSVNRIDNRDFVTGGPAGARLISCTARADDTSFVRDARVLPGAKEFYWSGQRRCEAASLPAPGSSSAGAFSIARRPYGATNLIDETAVIVGGDYNQLASPKATGWYFEMSKRIIPHNEVPPSPWHAAITPPHGYRSSVAYDPTHKTWITAGPNGTDVSTDDGRNWRPLKPGPGQPLDTDKNWNALSLPFVVGPHGRIGRLRDDALKP